jgi:hypothetical protein
VNIPQVGVLCSVVVLVCSSDRYLFEITELSG